MDGENLAAVTEEPVLLITIAPVLVLNDGEQIEDRPERDPEAEADGGVPAPRKGEGSRPVPPARRTTFAETAYWLVRQPRSAWSFEVEARPFGENW